MSRIERRNTQNALISNKASFTGAIAFKDTPEASNRRYIWIDYLSKEIRWSVGSMPQNLCKRLSISFIHKVSKASSACHFGFKIESKSHTIVFWLLNEKEANHWVSEISGLMCQDENLKARKRASSVLNTEQRDSNIRMKVLNIINTLVPNAQVCKFEDSVEVVRNFLNSQSEFKVSDEVKVLKEQAANLQSRIKSMEEVKAEYDKYSVLEDEYLKAKNFGIDLSKKLDKLQAEKSELSRDSRIVKNQISSISSSSTRTENSKDRSTYGGIVTIDGQHKLVNYLPELFTLFIYPLYEFSTVVEKLMYAMVKSMQVTEKNLSVNYNDSVIVMTGESDVLDRIKESYEKYKKIQENSQEKTLIHYLSVCDESDRQLRALDKQVKGYKKLMTVRHI